MYFDASRAMRTLVVTPDNLEVLLAMPLHSLCPHLHTLVFRGPLPGSAQPSSSSSSLGPSVFAHATPCPQPPNNNLARPAQPGLHPAAAQAAIMTLQAAAMPGFPYLADQLTALVTAAPPPAPAPQPLAPITAAAPPAALPAPAVPPPFAPLNMWGTAAAQPAVATLNRQLGHPTSASTPDLTTEQPVAGSTAAVIEPAAPGAAGPSAAVAGAEAAAAAGAGAGAGAAGAGSVGLEAAAVGPAAPPLPGFQAGAGLGAGRDAGLGMLAALPQGLPEPSARPRSAAQGQAAPAGAADSGPGFDLSMVEQFARDVLPHLHVSQCLDRC
ncbi:hypothetical protein V8C86DRAFT_117321 [Haematococcus lacustris]